MNATEFTYQKRTVEAALLDAQDAAKEFALDLPPDHHGIAAVQNRIAEALADLRLIEIPF